MTRCVATTVKGAPCRGRALPGSDRCQAHRRAAPDEQAVAQLVSMLRAGNYLEIAARAAGVDLAELLEHPEIRDELEAARAESEAANVARVAGAARDNWQAAAWLLERQHPDRWARPAVRADEKPPPPLAAADGLDDLASKRIARRRAAAE